MRAEYDSGSDIHLPESSRLFIKRLPKCEIHFHFEGALSADTIFRLARKYNVPVIKTLEEANWYLYFSNAHEFFQKFLYCSTLFREPEDFYLAAKAIGVYLSQENIRYIEITLAPHKFVRSGIPYKELITAIDCGLQDSKKGEKREHRFIIDVVRNLGFEAGMETVNMIERHPFSNVVGIGLGGSEDFPPGNSAAVFEYAASIGLRKTAHAGEGRGAKSVWGALTALGAERIDHGVRSREDPKLVDYLTEKQIPLNMCLTSNVMLKVVPSLEKHPFRFYKDRGIPVTIGTDDPGFFKTTLSNEFEKLIKFQGLSIQDIPKVNENAISASFLSEYEKCEFLRMIHRDTQKLARELEINHLAP